MRSAHPESMAYSLQDNTEIDRQNEMVSAISFLSRTFPISETIPPFFSDSHASSLEPAPGRPGISPYLHSDRGQIHDHCYCFMLQVIVFVDVSVSVRPPRYREEP